MGTLPRVSAKTLPPRAAAQRPEKEATDERQTLDALFAASLPKLRRAAGRFFRNHEDIEDIVQESLFAAYRNWGQFEGRSEASTWLHSIVVNRARMELRSRKSRGTPFAGQGAADGNGWSWVMELTDAAPNPENRYFLKEASRTLREKLAKLPESLRCVLQSYYFSEFSVREGAAALGISTSTFKARLRLGRQALWKLFRRERLYTGLDGVRLRCARLPREPQT